MALPASTTTAPAQSILADLIAPISNADQHAHAAALLDEFGTLAAVLAGSRERVARATGRPPLHDLLAAHRAVMVHALRERVDARPVLGTGAALTDYLWMAMAHEPRECLRALYLDRGDRLIRDEVLRVGSLDTIHIEPRDVMIRALELGAVGLVLAHNHPSGDPTPSGGDQQLTQRVANAGHYLGIRLLAHLVVAKAGAESVQIYPFPS
ncbi:MAG: JAB domain-containing protein [Sphingomonas sp.]